MAFGQGPQKEHLRKKTLQAQYCENSIFNAAGQE